MRKLLGYSILLWALGLGSTTLSAQCLRVTGISPAAFQGCGGSSLNLFLNFDQGVDFIGLYYSLNGSFDSTQLYNTAQHTQLGIFPIDPDFPVAASSSASYQWSVPTQLNGSFFVYAILGQSSPVLTNSPCRSTQVSGQAILVRPGLEELLLIGDSTRICQGNTAFLTATGAQAFPESVNILLNNAGGNFQIPAGASLVQVPVQPVQNTLYRIASAEYQTSPICLATKGDSAQVLVRPDLSTSFLSGSADICAGQSHGLVINTPNTEDPIEVQLTDGSVLTLSASETGQPYTYTVSPNSTQTYAIQLITYLDNPQCGVSNIPGTVTVRVRTDLSLVTLTGDSICQNGTARLTLQLPQVSSPLVASFQGASTETIPPNTGTFVIPLSPTTTTTYSLSSLRYSNQPECEVNNVASATITVAPIPVADFIPEESNVCYSNPTCVINQSTGDNLRYQWQFGSEFQSTDTDPCAILWEPVAQQIIRLRVENPFGCRDSISRTVNVDYDGPAPAQIVRVRKQDDNSGVLLIAQDTANQKENIESYQWFLADGQALTDPQPLDFYFHNNLTDSIYVVTKLNGSVCLSRSFLSRESLLGPAPSETLQLRLFPNPSQGRFQVQINGAPTGKGALEIWDLKGRLIWRRSLEKEQATYQTKLALSVTTGAYWVVYKQEGQAPLHTPILIH